MKTVKEFLKESLKKQGFDGLCNPGECGCTFLHGHDFIPCGNDFSVCSPAYFREADPKNPDEKEYQFMMDTKKNKSK